MEIDPVEQLTSFWSDEDGETKCPILQLDFGGYIGGAIALETEIEWALKRVGLEAQKIGGRLPIVYELWRKGVPIDSNDGGRRRRTIVWFILCDRKTIQRDLDLLREETEKSLKVEPDPRRGLQRLSLLFMKGAVLFPRINKLRKRGLTVSQIAAELGIDEATVYRNWQAMRDAALQMWEERNAARQITRDGDDPSLAEF